MILHWKNKKLQKTVLEYAQSDKPFAKKVSRMKAAASFVDLRLPTNGRAHFLEGALSGMFALDFVGSKRLICEPYGDFEKQADGKCVESTVTELIVVDIENDYH